MGSSRSPSSPLRALLTLALLGAAVAAAAAAAAAAGTSGTAAARIKDGKLQAISSAGIAEQTVSFSSETCPSQGASKVLTLPSTSTLKLSFAADTTSGSGSVDGPSYASLIFRTLSPSSLSAAIAAPVDPSAAQGNLFRRANAQAGSVSVPLQPKKGGKYRWEWDLVSSLSAHEDILALAQKGDGRVRAQVYTVSSDGTPELRELGTVYFSDEASWNRELGKARKYPREWEMERYSPRPELHWTFQPPRRQVGPTKAALGLALVLSPWLLLAALTSQILPALSVSLPAITFPFITSLVLLEACVAAYWVGAITVWRFMPLVGGIGLGALLSGKTALSDRMERRLKGEAKSNPIEKMQ